MRVNNLTQEIQVVDEYIDTGLLQLRMKLMPGNGVFIDDTLAKRSKQLANLQQNSKVAMIPTSATVTLGGENGGSPGDGDQGVLTITPDPDTAFNATTPIVAYVTASVVPVTVRVTTQTSSTFTLTVLDQAGDPYVATDVEVYYSFGSSKQRLS